jgi:MFS family permease
MTAQSYDMPGEADRRIVIPALGLTQILAWGSTYYLLAVLAKPIAADTGWALPWIIGGLSLGLLIAGLVSPAVGRTIGRAGGRGTLMASSVLIGVGLCGLAASPNLPLFLAAWIVIGVGMGAGLYDAAFATLGRIYGTSARQAITTLTLFGGLASTACWPLSAYLVTEFGWRGACLAYAVLQILVCLPLYARVLPVRPPDYLTPNPEAETPPHSRSTTVADERRSAVLFWLLAASITASSAVSATLSVHLLTVLQARDIGLAAAVALGAVVGPSQVAARAIEMLAARYHHPIWTLAASALCLAIGVGVLWAGSPILAIGLVFYGAGIGLESIARGTVPLALFSTDRYAIIVGRLALPSLLAQASAPLAAGLLLTYWGAGAVLSVLGAIALLKVGLVAGLAVLTPRGP